MHKTLILAAAGLLVSGAAFAQSSTTSQQWVEVRDESIQVQELGLSVDQLEDMDLYHESGFQIGEVEDVLGTDRDTPLAVAVDIDTRNSRDDQDAIIAFTDLKLVDNRLVTSLTAEQIEALPRWND